MSKLTYTKNESIKLIEKGSGLIPAIEKDGWKLLKEKLTTKPKNLTIKAE